MNNWFSNRSYNSVVQDLSYIIACGKVKPIFSSYYWSLLCSAILSSRTDSLRSCCMWFWMSDCILLQRLFFFFTVHRKFVLTGLFDCCMAGATWNRCRLGAGSVYIIQACTSSPVRSVVIGHSCSMWWTCKCKPWRRNASTLLHFVNELPDHCSLTNSNTLRWHSLHGRRHTPSTAFRHLPPNSARFSYATEGALFISAQLSTDAVSALQKVWVLIRLWKQPSAQALT